MKNKSLAIGAIIIGILFIILAIMYWTIPAGSLPTYIPGFETGVATIHFKHGLASLILGIGLFIYAWFQTGGKKSTEENTPSNQVQQ